MISVGMNLRNVIPEIIDLYLTLEYQVRHQNYILEMYTRSLGTNKLVQIGYLRLDDDFNVVKIKWFKNNIIEIGGFEKRYQELTGEDLNEEARVARLMKFLN